MIDRFISVMSRALKYLTAIMLVVLAGIVFLQVILRFGFKSGLNWNEEVARFLFTWVVFIGSTAAILDRSHMAVTFLEEWLPRTAPYVLGLTWILETWFFAALLWYGYGYCRDNMDIQSSALKLPMGVVYMIMPLCAAVCLLFILYQLYCAVSGRKAVTE